MRARRKHPEREDARYLDLRRRGKTIEGIALLCGVSTRTVRKGVAAAKARQKEAAASSQPPPKPRQPAWVADMVPLFPIPSLTEESECPHRGPIPRGSMFVCMICHQSGMDHRGALRRDPATDPKPTPKPTSAPLTRESKKQRRKREAAEKAAKSRAVGEAA